MIAQTRGGNHDTGQLIGWPVAVRSPCRLAAPCTSHFTLGPIDSEPESFVAYPAGHSA